MIIVIIPFFIGFYTVLFCADTNKEKISEMAIKNPIIKIIGKK